MINFDSLYNAVIFKGITAGSFKPAIVEAMNKIRAEIDRITGSADEPDFENTVEAF